MNKEHTKPISACRPMFHLAESQTFICTDSEELELNRAELLPLLQYRDKREVWSPVCAGLNGLTGSLRDLLISVREENAASDFDEVSVFTDNLAVSGDIGRRLLKRGVEREEAEGSCLFTVTQTVCLSAS